MAKRNIQNEILLNLLASNGLKFSEAQPIGVENDLYNYHLQFLVQKKLVTKANNLYMLSGSGKAYIERNPAISDTSGILEPFKISVLMLVTKVENKELQILLQTRTRQPFFGDTGILSGKVQKEEKIVDAAKRKFFEETNLSADFESCALLRRVRYNLEGGKLFSDSFWFLCKNIGIVSGNLQENYVHGKNFWASLDEAIDFEVKSIEKSDFMLEYLKKLKKDPKLQIPFTYAEEYSNVRLE